MKHLQKKHIPNEIDDFKFTWENKKSKAKVFRKKSKTGSKNALTEEIIPANRDGDGEVNEDTVTENVIETNNIEETRKKFSKKKQKNKLKGDFNLKNNNQNTYKIFSNEHKDLYIDTEEGDAPRETVFTSSGNRFNNLSIHKHLVSNLEKHNYIALTTVQERAIPIILSGRDTLVSSIFVYFDHQ